MRIRVLRNLPKRLGGYEENKVYDVDNDEGKKLIELGQAEVYDEAKAAEDDRPVPVEVPTAKAIRGVPRPVSAPLSAPAPSTTTSAKADEVVSDAKAAGDVNIAKAESDVKAYKGRQSRSE